MKKTLLSAALLAAMPAISAAEVEVSGKVGFESRLYQHDGLYPNQPNSNLSVMAEPEFYWESEDANNSLVFKPFLRLDEHDDERSHFDVRELLWTHVNDDFEIKAGISKVFWGVTEFQHLTDVINQTDGVEDLDGEDKLGQPMINLSLVWDWGILDLFVLPGFRERTFAGEEGRLRGPAVINTDKARYQSGAKDKHIDLSVRYSHSVGDYDFGLYWFNGTNRDPIIRSEQQQLIPYYEQMNQVGLDLQATKGDWLWKFETIYRDSDSYSFAAAQGGFEYTLVGINETAMDLGLLMEYGWNNRNKNSQTNQNDLFVGSRLTLNDAESTELLAGASYDFDYQSHSFLVEASRRFGDSWKVSLDARLFSSDEQDDSLYAIRDDDQLQLTVEYYY